MQLSNAVYTVLNELISHGQDAYLVGGAVRNHLLGIESDDYDVTTSADPDAIKEIFRDYRFYDVGKKHGTVTILIGEDKIDVTPYRFESGYHDHRHPDTVSFTADLKEDLKRRDFTVNAMCLDHEGKVIDLFKGMDDLHNKLIRTVGDPYERFEEDALRILRALRFAAKLDFQIEEKTAKAIHECKDLLKHVSNERKRAELLQILASPEAFRIINEYLDVFDTFMKIRPIARKRNDFSQPLFALAYLLKDNEDNDLKKLKYSAEEIALVKTLIEATKADIGNDDAFVRTLSNPYQNECLTFLMEYHHADLRERYEKLKEYMITLDQLQIDGDTIASYGYRNKEIGLVKKTLTELVHRQELKNDKDALQKYLTSHTIAV
jgi:tRNA nucleotidyltransferase (CCA-adding enzyme)